MPFVKFNVKKYTEMRCAEDPEFRKYYLMYSQMMDLAHEHYIRMRKTRKYHKRSYNNLHESKVEYRQRRITKHE